ncbi:SDR family NAD(P)-dependent oxidoreductase [Clostridium disporicum]|jgi:short-subunit dehydrogenase|uniref:Short chain dehydrogenase n=1 Tax=Clostridium disporicum TaxID=84024 RepID=A0A174EMC4_9CLOT|nr:SDR family oxidoreductase [Clostridium disporicum]CUO38397.1 short chain dehydrogenase [Clostridium disporicum]
MDNNYVLITGASSGIGYELAKLFERDGYNLILVARDKEKLQMAVDKLNNEKNKIIMLDVDLSREDEVDKLIKYINKNEIDINILVNNAGIGSFGEFAEIDWKTEEKLIDINIKALTKLTKYFLPKMIEKKSGGILNVASTAAFASGPRMATYYASKAYVLNLTEAIHEEVKEYGINISCLCPGPVRTSFQSKAGIKKSEKAKKYLMNADIVAKVGYDKFKKGEVIIIPGFKNRVLVNANKLLPRAISRKIILKTNKK